MDHILWLFGARVQVTDGMSMKVLVKQLQRVGWAIILAIPPERIANGGIPIEVRLFEHSRYVLVSICLVL